MYLLPIKLANHIDGNQILSLTSEPSFIVIAPGNNSKQSTNIYFETFSIV